ncbi:MAG: CoA-acylating methylmalonate-semialdehyde dehydrogenase [Bifidobacteriaceae bacterium]|jgi:malonate-semialdehyde dehydrogenase (acetylating)/methylmalonate-semialdehyde dehydrogenase|nr:CoA-acylating methylmalonate-semialdehyde dehydrogenase [Bifidobacteriaceae bacterium]
MNLPLIPNLIGGQLVGTPGSEPLAVRNPATGEALAQVAEASPAQIESAVQGAGQAFAAWSQVPLGRRAAVLFKLRALLAEAADEIAAVISREQGKVLSDARGEVARGLEVVDFACGIPQLLKGEYSPQVANGVDVVSWREPLGVTVGVTPFNFPIMVPLWMSPMAIATGNAFILKPSPQDPSAALKLAELWQAAGLPDGVFQVLQGGPDVVNALLADPLVRAVSFVGSTPVARQIHATAVTAGKRVQALGGAKNHAIVLADANAEFAADSVIAAAFGAAGQRCMALSVVLVEDSIADDFVTRVVAKAKAVKVAAGDQAGADMGPLISARARDRAEAIVSGAERAGAKVVLDGRGFRPEGLEAGFFTGPTVLDGVTADMPAYTEEIFGPVLSVVRIRDLDDGIGQINANPYGNGTALFTSSGEAARRFELGVRVGMIGINVPIPVPVGFYSFGGWKDSLIGDFHIYGPESVNFYTQAKVSTRRWPAPEHNSAASFHFGARSK